MPQPAMWPCRQCGGTHPQPCNELYRLAAKMTRCSGTVDHDEAERIRVHDAQRPHK